MYTNWTLKKKYFGIKTSYEELGFQTDFRSETLKDNQPVV